MRKRVLLILLVLTFGVRFYSVPHKLAHSKDKPIELSYSSFFPATYGLGKAATAWAEEIEKRTNGRVKITSTPFWYINGRSQLL